MSRSFRILSLCLIFAPGLHAQQLTPAEEKALLAKIHDHRVQYPAMSADFSEERTTRLLNKPLLSTGTIAFRTPNKFRRELKGNSPSLTVCNGTELWIYYPNFKEAEHYTLGRKQFFDDSIAALTAGLNFQDLDRFFRITASRDGTGYRVALAPRTSSLRRILTALTVSLDSDGLIEKSEATLPKGDRIVTTYRNVRPAKQSDARFEFVPPPDAHVSTPLGE